VSGPGAEARFAHENRAAVHLVNGLGMGDAVAVAAAEQAHVVGPVGDVGEEIGNLDATLAARSEFAAGREKFVFGDGAAGFEMAEGFGNGLAGKFDEVR